MSPSGAVGSNLRAVTRRAVQAQIAAQAMRLFSERGFDETTVDQIAAAAGISSRSFFRYFPTKEDVVVGDQAEHGAALRAALQARPSIEPPWVAIRHALGTLVDEIRADPVFALRASAVLLTTASLRARHLEKQLLWTELLVPEIVARLADDTPRADLRARAIVSAALICLDVALNQWIDSGGADDIGALLDAAVDAVTGQPVER
ncbi:TetR family transcriptional regulator [Micromonospora sp. 067-2]|uniref:TetR family transcriptional regulator n=1 Tax=Micromonospora sp. 067-2 TaxID=2789270 RepID=UPI00397C3938